MLVFLPAPLVATVLGLLAFPAVAYLAFFGWVVPAALVEGTGFRESFRRAIRLARADYVHALGGLATLVIVFYVVRLMLALLIRGGGEVTERSAALLADLVLSPILFVGSAILPPVAASANAEAAIARWSSTTPISRPRWASVIRSA